jgi:predicted DNA-binding transcriptional regulator AlpA
MTQQKIHGGTRTRSILVDERTAATMIDMTPRFLQERRRRGNGPPFVQISSRCIRYRPEDIEAWAEERLRTSTSDQGPA